MFTVTYGVMLYAHLACCPGEGLWALKLSRTQSTPPCIEVI